MVNTEMGLFGKSKNEIWNMLVDSLSERLIRWGEYVKRYKK